MIINGETLNVDIKKWKQGVSWYVLVKINKVHSRKDVNSFKLVRKEWKITEG